MSTRSKLAPKAPTKVVRPIEKSTNDKVVKKNEKTVPLKIVKKKVESESDSDSEIYEIPQKTQKVTKAISKNEDSDSDSDFYGEIPEDKILSMKKRIIKSVITSADISSSSDFSDDESDKQTKPEYKRKSRAELDYNKLLFAEGSDKSTNTTVKKLWETLKKYDLPDKANLRIIKSHPGHIVKQGCDAGFIKNPHWLVYDKKSKDEYYIMYCETGGYTKFAKEDYTEVINPANGVYPSWHLEKIGYILSKTYHNGKAMYLHQVICQKHNEKKYITQSVDHINCDKLDNRHTNLRFTSQSIQNQNRGKKKRPEKAFKLPEGVDQQRDIPVYCYPRNEKYNPKSDLTRFFYVIEGHPMQKIKEKLKKALPDGQQLPQSEFPIRWATSKSREVSDADKLKAAQQKRKEYDDEFERKYPNEFKEWIKNGGKKY
jgi:hypothetical protein